jgi:hypothetical protein
MYEYQVQVEDYNFIVNHIYDSEVSWGVGVKHEFEGFFFTAGSKINTEIGISGSREENEEEQMEEIRASTIRTKTAPCIPLI